MTDQQHPEPPFGLGSYTARELKEARAEYERAIGHYDQLVTSGKMDTGEAETFTRATAGTVEMLKTRLAAVIAEQDDRERHGNAITDRYIG